MVELWVDSSVVKLAVLKAVEWVVMMVVQMELSVADQLVEKKAGQMVA